MKTYVVGGYVRDRLLGKSGRDKDYVVTNTTSWELEKQGFVPVGRSYRIYLHPVTGEEYSLANDLRSDLLRRDLTINAIAMDGDKVIDCFGGIRDLKNKLLRHIKDVNLFEDPLRVYRIARIRAQFSDFSIHPDTLKVMQMVAREPTFSRIPRERIFGELEKALSLSHPVIFFEVLKLIRGLGGHFQPLEALTEKEWDETMDLLVDVSHSSDGPVVRYASLFLHLSNPEMLNQNLGVPVVWAQAAKAVSSFGHKVASIHRAHADEIVHWFYLLDAFRKPFLIDVLEIILKSLGEFQSAHLLRECFLRASEVRSRDLDLHGIEGRNVSVAFQRERIRRVQHLFKESPAQGRSSLISFDTP